MHGSWVQWMLSSSQYNQQPSQCAPQILICRLPLSINERNDTLNRYRSLLQKKTKVLTFSWTLEEERLLNRKCTLSCTFLGGGTLSDCWSEATRRVSMLVSLIEGCYITTERIVWNNKYRSMNEHLSWTKNSINLFLNNLFSSHLEAFNTILGTQHKI